MDYLITGLIADFELVRMVVYGICGSCMEKIETPAIVAKEFMKDLEIHDHTYH